MKEVKNNKGNTIKRNVDGREKPVHSITVENLNKEEVVLFQDINGTNNHYSILDKILSNNSVHYTFQFWDSGSVTLSPIIIDIKKFNQNKGWFLVYPQHQQYDSPGISVNGWFSTGCHKYLEDY